MLHFKSLLLLLLLLPRLLLLLPRDQQEVLAEDMERLRVMQPHQPWFTQQQREELAKVHPWVQQHTLPKEIDTQVRGGHTHTHTHARTHMHNL